MPPGPLAARYASGAQGRPAGQGIAPASKAGCRPCKQGRASPLQAGQGAAPRAKQGRVPPVYLAGRWPRQRLPTVWPACVSSRAPPVYPRSGYQTEDTEGAGLDRGYRKGTAPQAPGPRSARGGMQPPRHRRCALGLTLLLKLLSINTRHRRCALPARHYAAGAAAGAARVALLVRGAALGAALGAGK